MQSDVASKLSEIFSCAGQAFSRMAELTMQLQQGNQSGQPLRGKWSSTEVDMLKGAVERFGSDLERIGNAIKDKTGSKGAENVPVHSDSKTTTDPPPVIRNVAANAPNGIAPPLVLSQKPPVKEQKARRGGSSAPSAGKRPGPASKTLPATVAVAAPPAGPKLASMLDNGKRAVAGAASSESTDSKRVKLSQAQRMKMLREVEDDFSDEEEDSDEDESDTTEDDDDE